MKVIYLQPMSPNRIALSLECSRQSDTQDHTCSRTYSSVNILDKITARSFLVIFIESEIRY